MGHKSKNIASAYPPEIIQIATPNNPRPMMWNLGVPKIMHTYWGGKVLPYIRYKTIESFLHYNPDWEVRVWTSSQPVHNMSWTSREHKYPTRCKDFTSQLWGLPVHKCVLDFEAMSFSEGISEVYKADLTRIYVLKEIGGGWSDMDVIYFAPMNQLYINTPENRDKETYVCVSHYGHSTGFMISMPGGEFFSKLLEVVGEEYNPNHYQCLGPCMFDKYWPKVEDIPSCVNMSTEVVYAHDANHIKELLSPTHPRFTEKSIGCHWYAGYGGWGNFINKTNGGLTSLPPSIISNLLRDDIHIRKQRDVGNLSKQTHRGRHSVRPKLF